MRESLWKVAEQLSAHGVQLLGEQTDIVGVRGDALEELASTSDFSHRREGLNQPEGADAERAFVSRKVVKTEVAVHEAPLVAQPGGDRITVLRILGSSGGKKPVNSNMSTEASSSSEPKVCVNAPAASFHPSSSIVERISARASVHYELGVDEVPRCATDLPDSLVGLLPPERCRVCRVDEESGRDLVESADLVCEKPCGVQQLAVDVELRLAPRCVPDPHRPTVAVPPEMIELVLGHEPFPADAIEDLKVPLVGEVPAGGRRDEGEEIVGLIGTGGNPQGLEGEARIPNPREPLVPVPGPPNRLGQRGRRGGDDGARRGEGERLEHSTAMAHQVLVGAVIGLMQ